MTTTLTRRGGLTVIEVKGEKSWLPTLMREEDSQTILLKEKNP